MAQRSQPVLVLGAYARLSEYPRPGFMVRGRLCVYVLGILISSCSAAQLLLSCLQPPREQGCEAEGIC